MIEVGKVDLRDLERGLAGLIRASRDLLPMFREARKPLRADQIEHARQQMGPDGKWPARSPFTEERQRRRATGRKAKQRKKARRRRMLGKLPGAIKVTADRNRVAATSLVPWSAVHQRKSGGIVGRGSRIPGRPFLWPSHKLVLIVARLAVAHLGRGWGK